MTSTNFSHQIILGENFQNVTPKYSNDPGYKQSEIKNIFKDLFTIVKPSLKNQNFENSNIKFTNFPTPTMCVYSNNSFKKITSKDLDKECGVAFNEKVKEIFQKCFLYNNKQNPIQLNGQPNNDSEKTLELEMLENDSKRTPTNFVQKEEKCLKTLLESTRTENKKFLKKLAIQNKKIQKNLSKNSKEIKLLKNDLGHLENELLKRDKKIEKLEINKEELKRNKEELEKKIKSFKTELEEHNLEKEKLQKNAKLLKKELEKIKKENEKELKELKLKLNNLKEKKTEAENKTKEKEQKIKEITKNLNELTTNKTSIEKKLKEQENTNNLQKQNHELQIKALENTNTLKIKELTNKLNSIKKSKKAIEREKEELERQLNAFNKKLKNLTTENNKIKESLKHTHKISIETSKNNKKLSEKNIKQKKELEKLNSELNSLKESLKLQKTAENTQTIAMENLKKTNNNLKNTQNNLEKENKSLKAKNLELLQNINFLTENLEKNQLKLQKALENTENKDHLKNEKIFLSNFQKIQEKIKKYIKQNIGKITKFQEFNIAHNNRGYVEGHYLLTQEKFLKNGSFHSLSTIPLPLNIYKINIPNDNDSKNLEYLKQFEKPLLKYKDHFKKITSDITTINNYLLKGKNNRGLNLFIRNLPTKYDNTFGTLQKEYNDISNQIQDGTASIEKIIKKYYALGNYEKIKECIKLQVTIQYILDNFKIEGKKDSKKVKYLSSKPTTKYGKELAQAKDFQEKQPALTKEQETKLQNHKDKIEASKS